MDPATWKSEIFFEWDIYFLLSLKFGEYSREELLLSPKRSPNAPQKIGIES